MLMQDADATTGADGFDWGGFWSTFDWQSTADWQDLGKHLVPNTRTPFAGRLGCSGRSAALYQPIAEAQLVKDGDCDLGCFNRFGLRVAKQFGFLLIELADFVEYRNWLSIPVR